MSETEVTIVIHKVFELKGMIKEVAKEIEDVKKIEDDDKANVEGKNKGKSNKSEKQSTKTKGGKKEKENKIGDQKFSNLLSEAEQTSFEGFTKKKAEFCFDTINIVGKKIHMQPNSTTVIRIGFALPDILSERKAEEIRKLSEKGKGKAGKEKKSKDGKKSGSTKSSKQAKDGKGGKLKQLPEDQIYHVTKYNIMLNKTFLRDFILISTFIE